ncbi:MAG: hypothetical protein ACJ77K_08170 [Bacteroidia bacterium]
MGHERLGYLPKTRTWTKIVGEIAEFSENPEIVSEIAKDTTESVRNRFSGITKDEGVINAFKFLVLLSHSTQVENPYSFLEKNGIKLSSASDAFDISISAKQFIEEKLKLKEYGTLATQSTLDTIADWFSKNESKQGTLNIFEANPLEKWKKAGTGAGFSEISRLFFSNFTKRYLRYFLEREAAWRIQSVDGRVQFNKRIDEHVDKITLHAFETAKITQGFSAGWFNKNGLQSIPSDKGIQGFLSFAFKKINSELVRGEGEL